MKSCTRLCKKQKIGNFKLFIKIHPFRSIRQHTRDVFIFKMEDLDAYDTSEYPRDHPAYIKKNKKVLQDERRV